MLLCVEYLIFWLFAGSFWDLSVAFDSEEQFGRLEFENLNTF